MSRRRVRRIFTLLDLFLASGLFTDLDPRKLLGLAADRARLARGDPTPAS